MVEEDVESKALPIPAENIGESEVESAEEASEVETVNELDVLSSDIEEGSPISRTETNTLFSFRWWKKLFWG